jgi:galactose oxidase
VTHAFDQNQRFVPVAFARSAGGLTVTAPPGAAIAPPGHYMLFLLDADGIPSVARIIRFS